MNLRTEFESMISDMVDETGISLKESSDELSAYMSERALRLSLASGEPGFAKAVTAERNNVAMKAGILAAGATEQVQGQWLGMIGGALRIAAIALA